MYFSAFLLFVFLVKEGKSIYSREFPTASSSSSFFDLLILLPFPNGQWPKISAECLISVPLPCSSENSSEYNLNEMIKILLVLRKLHTSDYLIEKIHLYLSPLLFELRSYEPHVWFFSSLVWTTSGWEHGTKLSFDNFAFTMRNSWNIFNYIVHWCDPSCVKYYDIYKDLVVLKHFKYTNITNF